MEHLQQVASHGDFLHWIRQLPLFDPEAICPTRVLTGDNVSASAEHGGDVETLVDFPDQAFRGLGARCKVEIVGADRRERIVAAAGVARGMGLCFSRGERVVEEVPQNAVLDDCGLPGRDAFTIERRGAQPARQQSVVHDAQMIGSNPLVQELRQKRRLLEDRIPIRGRRDAVDERSGHQRIEYHRHASALYLFRSEHPQSAKRRLASHLFGRVQILEQSLVIHPIAGL